MGYDVKGQLLEVCTCKILCPCWVGEDPDFGTCDGVLAWHYDEGQVNGVDQTKPGPGSHVIGLFADYLFHDHAGALAGHGQRRGGADPGAATRHHRHPIAKSHRALSTGSTITGFSRRRR